MTTHAPDWADEEGKAVYLNCCLHGATEPEFMKAISEFGRVAYERGKAERTLGIGELDALTITHMEGYQKGKADGERSGRIKGLREAADMSDNWKPIRRLLPDATDNHNEGAFVGQHEASERIANAIRFRADELEQESVNTYSPPPHDEV